MCSITEFSFWSVLVGTVVISCGGSVDPGSGQSTPEPRPSASSGGAGPAGSDAVAAEPDCMDLDEGDQLSEWDTTTLNEEGCGDDSRFDALGPNVRRGCGLVELTDSSDVSDKITLQYEQVTGELLWVCTNLTGESPRAYGQRRFCGEWQQVDCESYLGDSAASGGFGGSQ